jgi:hypothetical protein
MLTLAQFDLPILIVALLIGVATARWLRAKGRPAAEDLQAKDDLKP